MEIAATLQSIFGSIAGAPAAWLLSVWAWLQFPWSNLVLCCVGEYLTASDRVLALLLVSAAQSRQRLRHMQRYLCFGDLERAGPAEPPPREASSRGPMSFMHRWNSGRLDHSSHRDDPPSRALLDEAEAADRFVLGLARAMSAPDPRRDSLDAGSGRRSADPGAPGPDGQRRRQQQPHAAILTSSAPPTRRSGRWPTPFGKFRLALASAPQAQGMQRAQAPGAAPDAPSAAGGAQQQQPPGSLQQRRPSSSSSSGVSAEDAPQQSGCDPAPANGSAQGTANGHAWPPAASSAEAQGAATAGRHPHAHVRMQGAGGGGAKAQQGLNGHSLDCIFPGTTWAEANGAARGQVLTARRASARSMQPAAKGLAPPPDSSPERPAPQARSSGEPGPMRRSSSSSLPRDSPVWRPGELGGPGGRLQTISMLPRGQASAACPAAAHLGSRRCLQPWLRASRPPTAFLDSLAAAAGASDGDAVQACPAAGPPPDAKPGC